MGRFFGFFVGVQVLVCTILVPSVEADTTYVSGIIDTNTVWDTAGSPYIVTGNVVVKSGVTLRIEPGVEVYIDSAKYIGLKGNLYAVGTEDDSIIISARDTTKRWSRLWFKPPSAGSLKYCRIEYAGKSAIFDSSSSTLYIGYNTITNNSAYDGGGICSYCSPIITHNTISNNSADYNGGGIYTFEDSAIITNNIITNNSAYDGGGISNSFGSPIITNNTITNNSAERYGGGIQSYGGSPTITNNIITNNFADGGGGIYSSGSPTIIHNTIINNPANYGGGGIYIREGLPIITYNTITNNSALDGGGIYNWTGLPTITHNIITTNSSESGIYSENGSLTIKYNTITDSTFYAIYIYSGSAFIRTNNISATGYAVYNNTENNIDARYNWWNTTDTNIIKEKIHDFDDDFDKGIVYYRPFLNTAFTDTVAPPAPINLTANGSNPSPGTNDNKFVINWINPQDTSGISEYYYKLGSAPTSDFDTTGTFHTPPDTINATQEGGQLLYVWLVDNSGNLNYQNCASVNLRYDTTAPDVPIDLLANGSSPSPWTDDSTFNITWTNPSDTSGIAIALYKLNSAPSGNYDTTGSLPYSGGIVFTTQEAGIPLYLWLVDSAGNVDYNNNASINLRYDVTEPDAPTLVAPSNNAIINDATPLFDWQDVIDTSGIQKYYIEVDTNSSFSSPIYSDSSDASNITPSSPLVNYRWLFWRVCAKDSAGNTGNWSDTFSFFIDISAPASPESLYANGSIIESPWTNDSIFVIRYVESDSLTKRAKLRVQSLDLTKTQFLHSKNKGDTSGIELALYKLGSPPSSNYDTTGTDTANPFNIICTQENGVPLYVWLKDNAGNLNYQNYASVNLRYDITAPIIDSTTVWEDTTDFWGPFEIKTKVTDNGEFHKPVMFYRTSTDTNWVARTMISIGGGWYVDSIPEQTQEDSIRIDYYLTAEDYATNTIRDPESGVYSFIVRRVGIEEYKKVPDKFVLFPPTPNPSLSGIVIKYGLPTKTNVNLTLYDISGRLVKTLYSGIQEKGYYTVNIKGLGKGIYFIKFKSNTFTSIKKLIILE